MIVARDFVSQPYRHEAVRLVAKIESLEKKSMVRTLRWRTFAAGPYRKSQFQSAVTLCMVVMEINMQTQCVILFAGQPLERYWIKIESRFIRWSDIRSVFTYS